MMKIRNTNKSTLDDIQEKFDKSVDIYSNLDTGQVTALDSNLIMNVIGRTAKSINLNATHLLDLGCGAGNYSLMILKYIQNLNCTLVDLSPEMLKKAKERIEKVSSGKVETLKGDFKIHDYGTEKFDIAVAATSLHHLRDDDEWELVFSKIFESLKPGGVFFISDLIVHDHPAIDAANWDGYWDYLVEAGGQEMRDWVEECIQVEDSPRSVNYQTGVMKKVGFKHTEVLHKNSVYAAFCGVK